GQAVPGAGYCSVEEHSVISKFHSHCSVRSCADAGVDNQRNRSDLFTENLQIGPILNTKSRPYRRPHWHNGRSTGVYQFAGVNKIVGGVRQYHKPVLDESAGGLEQAFIIGKQGVVVSNYLQLDPVGEAGLAGQVSRADSLLRRRAAGGIWKQK